MTSRLAELGLWAQSCAEPAPAAALPLEADAAVDLAIIGGGFTGLSAALTAAERGASVCLLEAGDLGQGGSGRNVGLVNAGLWLPPETVCKIMGQAAGHRLNSALAAAPDAVFDRIARHSIACEPQRKGTLHCAHSPAGLRDLQTRFQQGRALGAPLHLLDAGETAARTGAQTLHGALFDPRAGTIQPLAYARGLARAAIAAGADLHPLSPVQNIRRVPHGWELTARGQRIMAGRLLLATNAYHQGCAGLAAPRLTPVYFSQFATAPLPASLRSGILPGAEGCWDTDMVMSSWRMDAAGRLILGAIGNVKGAGGALHRGWARRKLRQLFPALGGAGIEHDWSGRIAMTHDHIPKVQRLGPDGLAVFGYSGRGIGPGTVFGAAAAKALLTQDFGALPVAPVKAHREALPALRAAGLELGASLSHFLRPRP